MQKPKGKPQNDCFIHILNTFYYLEKILSTIIHKRSPSIWQRVSMKDFGYVKGPSGREATAHAFPVVSDLFVDPGWRTELQPDTNPMVFWMGPFMLIM